MKFWSTKVDMVCFLPARFGVIAGVLSISPSSEHIQIHKKKMLGNGFYLR